MTKEQIQNILKIRYNQKNWKILLSQIFPKTELKTPLPLIGIDANVAIKAEKLGYIVLNEKDIERKIAVFDVTLAQGIILERNRVGLRNLLHKYWKDIDGAFIVFHKPEDVNWRFTYVSELTSYDTQGDFIKIKTEPKRFTYILGEGESIRTAAERFSIISGKNVNITLEDIKDVFNVGKLSDTFFSEYKNHYENFVEYLTGKRIVKVQGKYIEKKITEANIQLATVFKSNDKLARDFCKKLLGRIIFLYFIQKKGWLGVPSKSEWGQGDYNYLTNLFLNTKNPKLFYSEFLSKLFFDSLNVKRKDDLIELVKGEPCRIPYLNGGLFEEDDICQRNLIFEPNLFENLFTFLNQYNFTIYEDDPNDHTIAVDPEMLGHIFENLLEDNKDKGAFYTPKEIVHYMCQESLIEYLCTKLQIPDEAQEKEAITNFLKNKIIDNILKPEIDNINIALDNVKICDPAIGSGAFPMGLLIEIFTAKQTLFTFEFGSNKNFKASDIKLNIIQNSIYGVDIEKGAVDIARLRFWLSLIVDEEKPKALPNLDYKIVVGNSLVSKFDSEIVDIDWNYKRSIGKADEYIIKLKSALKKLSDKQKEFFKAKDKGDLKIEIRSLKLDILANQLLFNREQFANKNVIKHDLGFGLKPIEIKNNSEIKLKLDEFQDIIKNIIFLKENPEESLNFFDWKLDFPEIMNNQILENIGFDIIIGNPPYGAKLKTKDKSFFQNKYQTAKTIKGVQKGSIDTFTLFIELGHNLVNLGGNLNYIVPISITSSDSMTGIHSLIEKNCSEIRISSYSVRPQPVFENAVVNTSILFFKKDDIPCKKIYTTKMYRKNSELNLKHLVDNLEFIDVVDYKLQGRYPKISLDIERKILTKIFSNKTKIKDLLKLEGTPIYYRFAGGRYYKVITNYSTGSSAERKIFFDDSNANIIAAILSSNLYFWFYQIFSDNLNLKAYEIEVFGVPINKFNEKIKKELETIYEDYLKDIEKNSSVRQTEKYANIDSFREYKIGKSKQLIDKIDDLIAPLYDLTLEELNFIKNYEINYRLKDE